MKGAAAMSVEMWAVTEISSADGTAARTIQRPACCQLGAGVAAVSSIATARGADCSISRPHQAISAISATNSAAQTQRCAPRVENGSTTNGDDNSGQTLAR